MDRITQTQELVNVVAEQMCASIGVIGRESSGVVQQHAVSESAQTPQPRLENTARHFGTAIAESMRAVTTLIKTLPVDSEQSSAQLADDMEQAQRLWTEHVEKLRFVLIGCWWRWSPEDFK